MRKRMRWLEWKYLETHPGSDRCHFLSFSIEDDLVTRHSQSKGGLGKAPLHAQNKVHILVEMSNLFLLLSSHQVF